MHKKLSLNLFVIFSEQFICVSRKYSNKDNWLFTVLSYKMLFEKYRRLVLSHVQAYYGFDTLIEIRLEYTTGIIMYLCV